MFMYEKDGKLIIEVNNKNQVPTDTQDVVIEKDGATTKIMIDGKALSATE